MSFPKNFRKGAPAEADDSDEGMKRKDAADVADEDDGDGDHVQMRKAGEDMLAAFDKKDPLHMYEAHRHMMTVHKALGHDEPAGDADDKETDAKVSSLKDRIKAAAAKG